MATGFTTDELLDISALTGISKATLDDHLASFDSYITSETEDKVREYLTRYEVAELEYTSIEPNLKNFGARINPNNEKSDIKQKVAILLFATDLISSGSRLVRC